jgi:hypothetical protein
LIKRGHKLPLLFALAGDDPEAAKSQRERLYKQHLGDALEISIYRDAHRNEPLELRRQPIYVWTNPVRATQQDGLVFLWTSRGRAEAVGTIFSSAAGPMRGFTHEFGQRAVAVYCLEQGVPGAVRAGRDPGELVGPGRYAACSN